MPGKTRKGGKAKRTTSYVPGKTPLTTESRSVAVHKCTSHTNASYAASNHKDQKAAASPPKYVVMPAPDERRALVTHKVLTRPKSWKWTTTPWRDPKSTEVDFHLPGLSRRSGGPQLFESVSELDASVTSFPDEELAALCAIMYDDTISLPVEANEIGVTGMGAVDGASDEEAEETVNGLAVLGIPAESWPAPTSTPPSPPPSPARSKRPVGTSRPNTPPKLSPVRVRSPPAMTIALTATPTSPMSVCSTPCSCSSDWEALDWDAFQASHAVTGSPFTTPRGGEAESWVQLPAPAQEADDWTMIDSDGI